MFAFKFALEDAPKTSVYNKQIGIWLLLVCACIFVMLIIGGLTRLTHSGLSMVEWKPLLGILPPLNHVEWLAVFQKYQQYPEYQQLNIGMSLAEFKSIFWLEYIHRLWGRMIGFIFFLPFLFFLLTGRMRRSFLTKLCIMFVLGGLQGLMGWYMVKSGLASNPHVSQYRLTAHLLLAFIVYAFIFWIAMDLLAGIKKQAAPLRSFTQLLVGIIFITVASGGLVAGLKAGFIYNTFPLMDGSFIPQGLWMLEPLAINFFANMTTVQFDHRLLAESTFLLVVIFWLLAAKNKLKLSNQQRFATHVLLAMGCIQLSLGIGTLLLVVPTHLAVTHQGGAMLLLTAALFTTHRFSRVS
ncbi:MAG: COX15/CtaA family protein [Mariprofundales bacterium]